MKYGEIESFSFDKKSKELNAFRLALNFKFIVLRNFIKMSKQHALLVAIYEQ